MGRSFFPWGSSLALWPVFLRVTGATPLHPANPVLSMTGPVLMTCKFGFAQRYWAARFAAACPVGFRGSESDAGGRAARSRRYSVQTPEWARKTLGSGGPAGLRRHREIAVLSPASAEAGSWCTRRVRTATSANQSEACRSPPSRRPGADSDRARELKVARPPTRRVRQSSRLPARVEREGVCLLKPSSQS